MSDIKELESRIMVAMERLSGALGSMDGASGGQQQAIEAFEGQIEQLKQALEAERTASSQLRERVDAMKALKDRQQGRIDELEAELVKLRDKRREDRSELDGIVSTLEGLVKEAPHA